MALLKKGFTILWLVLIVFVFLLIMAFAYGFLDFSKVTDRQYQAVQTDQQVQELSVLESSDEIGSIEGDLDKTDFGDLDQGIDEVGENTNNL